MKMLGRVGMGVVGIAALALAACGGGSGGGSYTPPPPTTYTIGGSATGLSGTGLVLQDNGGDNLSVSASGSFTFATKLASGASYSVTVMTQPSGQTCTVASGSGTVSGNVTNVAVSCTNTSSSVTIGGTVTGLTGTGLVLQDNGGDNLTVSQSGPFTFATALASNKTYAVTVLTQPTGQTCTVTGGSGTTGTTNVTTVAVACSATAPSVGKFAYTASNGDGTIYGFTIDPNTGKLTAVAGNPYPDGTAPAAVSLAPNGKFAFSASTNGTEIYAYTIDPTSGQLAPVAGSPFPTGFKTGSAYPDIAVDSQSAHLYLASAGDGQVAGFAINSAGALNALAGSPYTAGAGAGAIPAFSPNGKFLYVMNQAATGTGANTVSGYAIAADGSLTAIPGSPFAAGTDPSWIVFTPNGNFAYVSDQGVDTISAYSVSSTTGVLTPMATPTYATDEHPQDLTIDASGTHLYVPVANGSTAGAVQWFTINADGTLGSSSSIPAGVTPLYLAIDPAAPYAYVASTGGAEVYGYSISPTTGALTALSGNPFSTGAGSLPQFITIDPSGKFGYTSNEGTANISGFAISLTTGALSAVPGSPFSTGLRPIFVSVSPEAPGIRD